ncbi:MAG TPA: site-specific DNA-methyltransferase, partial [Polyangiaceae bacterium]|nr:site-specific DNA-methyltransferase [Polyangiaceae bacterium]
LRTDLAWYGQNRETLTTWLDSKGCDSAGYDATQKPIALLERVITLCSEPGDLVIDPCCGSGSTLVAARLLGRRAIGIDVSEPAIAISRERLAEPVRTESVLLRRGREAYRQADEAVLAELGELDVIPVQRNRGMDAILRQQYRGAPVAVRVQRAGEPLHEAAELLARAGESKRCQLMILIGTTGGAAVGPRPWPDRVVAIESTRRQVAKLLATPALADLSTHVRAPKRGGE